MYFNMFLSVLGFILEKIETREKALEPVNCKVKISLF